MTGSGRRRISKKERMKLYEEYNHRCAYCGSMIEYKEMQVDHVKSIYLHSDFKSDMDSDELNSDENLMPSCRQCNFYKSTMSVEKFRETIKTTLMDNLRKDFNFRLAIKYGLVNETNKPIKFYFEEMRDE